MQSEAGGKSESKRPGQSLQLLIADRHVEKAQSGNAAWGNAVASRRAVWLVAPKWLPMERH